MRLIRVVTVLAAATVLGGIGLSQAVHADNVSDVKQALSTKQSAGSDLQSQLQAAQDAVSAADAKASAKAAAIQATKAKIKDASAKIGGYDKKIAAAQSEVDQRTKTMKQQLQSLQKQAGDSVTGNVYVDFVLNADGLDDAVSRSFTVNKLNTANQEALRDVQSAQTKLKTLKQDAVANQATLKAAEAKLEAEQDQMQTAYSALQTKQAALTAKIDANQSAVAALQGDLTKANAEALAAAKQAAAKQAAAKTETKATIQSTTQTATATAAAKPAATTTSTSASTTTSAPSSSSIGGIVGAAERYIGVPYVWGGSTPSGFDCSGLVAYAASQVGISLPRTAAAQSSLGSSVSLSALQPGDLLFWGGVGSASHVAIYVGGGRYIHAPQPGESVTIQSMSYYAPSFAKRL